MISQKVSFCQQEPKVYSARNIKKYTLLLSLYVERIFWRAFETVYGIPYNLAEGLHICRSLYPLFIVMPEAPTLLKKI
jgi:hypothetical protein